MYRKNIYLEEIEHIKNQNVLAFYEIEIASQLCLSGYVLITVKYNKKTHNVNF